MMGHNIHFKGEIWKLSVNYPFYPFYLEHCGVSTVFCMKQVADHEKDALSTHGH